MKSKYERLHEDFRRDTYWTRIYFESDDEQKVSTVLVCASLEYFWDLLHTKDFKASELEQWLKNIIEKWTALGERIFEKEIYYDVFATTVEGKLNGLEFLQKEITP